MKNKTLFITLIGLLALNLQTHCMENNPEVNQLNHQLEQLTLNPAVRLGTLTALYNDAPVIHNSLINHCITLTETCRNSDPIIHAHASQLAFNCLLRQFNQTQGMIQAPFFLYCYQLKQSTLDNPIFTAHLNRLVALATNRNIPDKPVVSRKLFN